MMNRRRGDGGVAGGDAELVQVRDDVARPEQTFDAGALVVVDLQIADIGAVRAERRRKVGADRAAHRRIKRVERWRCPSSVRTATPSARARHAGPRRDRDAGLFPFFAIAARSVGNKRTSRE